MAAKKAKAKKAAPKRKSGKPLLLSGGNPQIAKGYGDAPVKAYIAAMPDWKRDVGGKIDALITRAVPGVKKAVKWNSPFYGVEEGRWFLSFHVFARYVRVTFFQDVAEATAGRHVEISGCPVLRHSRRRTRREAIQRVGEAGEQIAGREDVRV